MFLEKEIKAVLGVLDELVFEFKEYSIFEDVKNCRKNNNNKQGRN